MQRSRTKFVSRLYVGAAMLLTAGCSSSTPAPAIFLGHVAILSGADSKPGKSAEIGIKLALEDLGPAASDDLAKRPLVVRHVDASGKDAETSLDNFEGQAARLVSINKVLGFLGGATRDEVLRLDRSHVPVLTPLGLRTSAMSDMVFATGLTPAVQGRVLGQFLAEQSPAGGALIVDPRRDEASVVVEHFRRAFAEAWSKRNPNGAAPRWSELSLPRDVKLADWAAVVLKDQPKSIVFAGAANDFESLRAAWGPAAPRLAFAGEDGAWRPHDGVAGQTIYLTTAFALGKETTKAHDFAKRFRAIAGDEPDVHAALAYDSLRLFAEALKKGQSEKADKIAEELLKIQDFAGLAGPLSFTSDRHLKRPAFVAAFEGGRNYAVKQFDP